MSAFGLFIAALAMVVGIIVGYVIRKVSYEKQIAQAHNSAEAGKLSQIHNRTILLSFPQNHWGTLYHQCGYK